MRHGARGLARLSLMPNKQATQTSEKEGAHRYGRPFSSYVHQMFLLSLDILPFICYNFFIVILYILFCIRSSARGRKLCYAADLTIFDKDMRRDHGARNDIGTVA